jgi:hypothetical protein
MNARPAGEVVADFAAGSDRLAAFARDWAVGQFRHPFTANADAILRGLAMLLVELRTKETNDGA